MQLNAQLFRFKTTFFQQCFECIKVTHDGHRCGYGTIYNAERSDFRPNPRLGAKI